MTEPLSCDDAAHIVFLSTVEGALAKHEPVEIQLAKRDDLQLELRATVTPAVVSGDVRVANVLRCLADFIAAPNTIARLERVAVPPPPMITHSHAQAILREYPDADLTKHRIAPMTRAEAEEAIGDADLDDGC
jgi:hypothetical protein